MPNLETEFRFRTPRELETASVDAAVRESAFTYALTATRRHNDIYLDCSQRSLARCGIGLRVRVADDSSTVACKGRHKKNGALFVREEYEAPWSQATTPATAADLPDALRDVVEPIVLRRPLVAVLRLEVTRDLRRLVFAGNELCELAIDHVQAHGTGRSIQFSELELEVLDDLPTCEELAALLEQRLAVQAATDDKPTHAAHLLGMNGTDEWTTAPDFTANTPTSTAVSRILQRLLCTAQTAEIRVRQDHDTKSVRKMRTSLRRMRSLLGAFLALWPEEEGRWMLAHLRALGTELGRIRDCDAIHATLEPTIYQLPAGLQPGAERVLQWLKTRRRISHRDLVDWLRCPERLGDSQRFHDLVLTLTPELDPTPIADSTRDRLTDCTARLRQRTKHLDADSPIADLHTARIATKRLRYLSEELGTVAGGDTSQGAARGTTKRTAKTARRLARLQQALGALCDADTVTRQLLTWAPRVITDHPKDLLVGPALGALAQVQLTTLDAALPDALARIRRERKRLRRGAR